MRKTPDFEEKVMHRIRVFNAMHPYFSIQKLREQLQLDGLITLSGKQLDWHYVSKLVRKVRTTNLINMRRETLEDRMVDFRETTNVMIEHLVKIIEGQPVNNLVHGPRRYPNSGEITKAINLIMKLKVSALFIGEQVRAVQQTTTVTERLTFDPRSGKKSLTKKWAGVMPEVRPTSKNESN